MKFFLFVIFSAIGAGAGWALLEMYQQTLPISVGAGALITLFLGQIYLFSARPSKKFAQMDKDIREVSTVTTDVQQRMKVVEARTDAVETTVKHELSERKDALISEMQHLERLIERLGDAFEGKLSEAPTIAQVTPQDDPILRAVKSALAEGRVDLHLQPIVSLPQRRVAFYEGFTRLRTEDGALIMPAEFLDAARRSNLLSTIDNMTLFRCVQIVRKLAERDRRVGVFCNISASSLEDDAFFPDFLAYMEANRDLAGALIFELQADRFEGRSRKMRQNMDQLVNLGFRFSIDHASGLALDLPRLQDAGIRYVKVNGDILLRELNAPDGERPISSIQRRLDGADVAPVFSRYGVTLISEKMEDEASVVEILPYDIPFGQGNVFGAPRPIKASLMEETAPPKEFMARLASAR